jgi:hypothetical protein
MPTTVRHHDESHNPMDSFEHLSRSSSLKKLEAMADYFRTSMNIPICDSISSIFNEPWQVQNRESIKVRNIEFDHKIDNK